MMLREQTTIAAQPWWRNAPPQRRRQIAAVITEARSRTRRRWERVRAYPDLAERVCQTIGLKRYDQWNGYVPPWRETNCLDRDGTDYCTRNDNPVRLGLVAILREVVDREKAAGGQATIDLDAEPAAG